MTVKLRNTTITIESYKIISSRLINNKLYSISIDIAGSVGDLIIKAERISNLSDELYIKFDELAKSI